jgi:flagellar motor switch protein FliN
MSKMDRINIELEVILGGTRMPIHQLLRMGRGAVIELDAREEDELEIRANDVPIARGQVVLRGERIGIAVSEVLLRSPVSRRQENVRKL